MVSFTDKNMFFTDVPSDKFTLNEIGSSLPINHKELP